MSPPRAAQTQATRSFGGHLFVDGTRLEWKRWEGAPGRPTLVLLHEGLGCVALWRDFPVRLVQRLGCPVVAYSRAGYGGSDPVSLPRPMSYMEDEALGVLPVVLERLSIENAILVGHSDGGSIALVAPSGAAKPRLRSLVTLAAHVFVEPVSLAGIRAAGKAFTSGSLRARLARYHGQGVDAAFHGWYETWLRPEFEAWNIEPYLEAVTMPLLAVQGDEDAYGTVSQLEAIRAQVSGHVETRVLPGCGHSVFVDQPDPLLDAMSEFFDRYQLLDGA